MDSLGTSRLFDSNIFLYFLFWNFDFLLWKFKSEKLSKISKSDNLCNLGKPNLLDGASKYKLTKKQQMNTTPKVISRRPVREELPYRIVLLILVGVLLFFTIVQSRPSAAAMPFANQVTHPMDGLTSDEILATKQILKDAGYANAETRYPLILLQEMPKTEVLAWKPGSSISRSAFVSVKQGNKVYEAIVDLTNRKVASWKEIEGVQTNIMYEEWNSARQIALNDPRVRMALNERGITDLSQVFAAPYSAGYFGIPSEEGRRLFRTGFFDLRGTKNHIWGKPVEGLLAVVDVNEGTVIDFIDRGSVPINPSSNAYDEASVGNLRNPLKLVDISQPHGKNYTFDNNVINWQNWSLHLRYDRRAGPVISMVSYQDGDRQRQLLYQGSLAEISVPYMSPEETWFFRTFMDQGEYGFGISATQLSPGQDCPKNATFISPVMPDDNGNPFTAKDIVCIFERNTGDPIWRHGEIVNNTSESRPQVDLVVRTISSLGNYDYVFDWIFNQAGAIEIMVGATGSDAVKGVAAKTIADGTAGEDTAYGTLVAPQIVAQNHDHYFNFRLDMDVDGLNNSFVKETLERVQLPQDNPRRSIWVTNMDVAKTDTQAKFDLDYQNPSMWRVTNFNTKNAMGYPPSYQIMSMGNSSTLLSKDDYPNRRANFTNHHLWITPYDSNEKYASGFYPNQSKGEDGLEAWTSRDRPIENNDLVAWYTLGFHHMPVAEDWPLLPTSWHGFMLKPANFFDRNPAINLRKEFQISKSGSK